MGFYVKQINNLHAPDGAIIPCKNVNAEIHCIAKRTDASRVGNLNVEIDPLLLPRAGIHRGSESEEEPDLRSFISRHAIVVKWSRLSIG
jgi:hypothetical protein